MPLYYFHVQTPDGPVWDKEGIDLPDLSAVREEAIQSARELMADDMRAGGRPDGREFHIVDASENLVLRIPFAEAFAISGSAVAPSKREIG